MNLFFTESLDNSFCFLLKRLYGIDWTICWYFRMVIQMKGKQKRIEKKETMHFVCLFSLQKKN
jgi:hypothetical protein